MPDTGSKGFLGGTSATANPYGGGSQNAARSLGAIGRALQQVGGQGAQIALELQAAKNSKTENDVINNWEEAFGRHEAEAMREKDPQKRIEKMDGLLSDLKESGLSKENMAPVVRDRLEAQWGRIATKYRNRALSQASQLMIEQARTSMGTRLDRAHDSMNMSEVRGVVTDAREQGVISAADEEAILFRSEREINRRKLDAFRDSDPLAAEELLNDPDFAFPESEKAREKQKIEIAKRKAEAQDVNAILGAEAIGEIHSKEDLARNLEGSPNIRPETAKKILKNWDNSKPLSFEEKTDLTDRMNALHKEFSTGKISREAYTKAHHELATEVFSFGRRDGTGGLRSRIHSLDPASWREGNLTSGNQDDRERKIEEMAATWDRSGGFGKPRKGDEPLTPVEALDAQSARELTEMAVKEWLKTEEGRNATPEQIRRQFIKEASSAMTDAAIEEEGENDFASEMDSILKSAGSTILPKQ